MEMNRTWRDYPVSRGLLSLLCLVVIGMSVWLTVEKLTGQISSLAGCGAGSDCANVLGSKWSVVFGEVPVSAFSSLVYLVVLVSLWVENKWLGWLRVAGCFSIVGAAVWFTVLQLWVLKAICPYCMTLHAVGTVIALWVFVAEWCRGSGRFFGWGGVCGLASVLGLIALQYGGEAPATYQIDSGAVLADEPGGVKDAHARGTGRTVEFFGGNKSYRVSALPHLGEPDAAHVVVKYFDYTCEACHKVDGQIKAIQAKNPGRLLVVVLPTPLERSCNPHMTVGLKDHAGACELARLAIRVWLADRSKFAEFHAWLFEFHRQPVELAAAMASNLVGEEKMKAVSAADVDALLAANVDDYRELIKTTPVLPKLLLGESDVMHGVASGPGGLEKVLMERFGLGGE